MKQQPQRRRRRAPKREEVSTTHVRKGIFCLMILLGVVSFCAVAGMLVKLMLVDHDYYEAKAIRNQTRSTSVTASRGTIYDRNGKVLASDVQATTIYCNPKEITDVKSTAEKLAGVLGGDASIYEGALSTENTAFAYVKRKVDQDKGEEVQSLGLDGIYFLDDMKRVYPYGSIAGQILGLVDVDGNGQTGLELYYDSILKGEPGKLVLQQGAYGMPIPDGTEVDEPAKDGQDIILSIDIDMQQYVEERLAKGVSDIGGEDGSAVLYDADSGDIIAIASTPYLDPSDRSNIEEGATSVKAITTQFEPGSIFKTASFCAMLEAGGITAQTTVDCPVYLEADEYKISDAHERAATTMTAAEVLAQSSNVGTSLLVQQHLGFNGLYDKIRKYGLNDATGVDYPGEAEGYLTNVSTWSLIQSYNVTFGQGISLSPLMITRFYGAIASGAGVAHTPHFLISKPSSGEEVTWNSEQIIDNTDAIAPLTDMLVGVVENGTGKTAAVEGYTTAGKTGTAEYADDTGSYVKDMYNLDFVGFLPNATSNLVCFVGVNHVPYERNTCEVFKDIMTEASSRYKIAQK
mgnify:CR=1 FL=1